jgi:peptidoglycan/LPS O-acetylase OafA/YrhL
MPFEQQPSAATISPPVPMERHRFHLLDALRGLAAIVVVRLHAPIAFKGSLAFTNSFLAVDFFFCLSGFVIAFSYKDRLRRGLSWRDFAAVRLIRLYPLYALGITVAATREIFFPSHFRGQSLSTNVFTILLSIFLVPNFVLALRGNLLYPLDGPAWSLFFELAANAVYAIVARLRSARTYTAILCALSLAGILWATLTYGTLDFGYRPRELFFGFARVGFSFMAGVLIFELFRSGKMKHLSKTASLVGFILVPVFLLGALLVDTSWTRLGLIQLLIVVLLFPALVLVGAVCSPPAPFVRVCAVLGNISYPLYMLHMPLMIVFNRRNRVAHFLSHRPGSGMLVFPAYLILLVAISWWLADHFDLPVRRRLTAAYKHFATRSRPELVS